MQKRIIALCLSLIMVLTLFISSRAEEFGEESEPDGKVTPICELEALRTKTSETYLLSDGTYDCVVYTENKYFEDAAGKLIPIDNTVVENKTAYNGKEYRYRNAANETVFSFAENEPAVLLSFGEKHLAYSLIGEKETLANVGGSENFKQIGDYALNGGNYIAYPGVAKSTELVYAVHNGSVKEYIVLEDAAAPTEFVFRFENEGHHVKETEYGRLGFFDENEEPAFELGSLYAVDAAGKYTDQLQYEVKEYDAKSTIIAIRLSEEYMADPERVFPILIDPTIMIYGGDYTYDTFVSSKYPTTNYYLENHVRTGYDDDLYVRRTYMRFIMPSYLYSGAYIVSSARIRLMQYIGTTPAIKAYRVTANWTSSNVTWNNKPAYTTTECSGKATLDEENWYNLYVTTIIQKQLNGTYGDYGVVIKDNAESGTTHWATFYSSDAPAPNRPELHITYRSPAFTFVSYVDTGYCLRFINGVTKVQTYSGFVKNKFSSIFGIDCTYYVNNYTSCADICKMLPDNTIPSSSLADACAHPVVHLSTAALRTHLIDSVGTGTNVLTRILWTGHIMNNHNNDRSNSSSSSNTVIITPYSSVNPTTYVNYNDAKVANNSKFTLMHELSHQIGAHDHYCYGNLEDPTCSNPYCYHHRSIPIALPDCIMSYVYSNMDGTNNSDFYCSQCIEIVSEHVMDHH